MACKGGKKSSKKGSKKRAIFAQNAAKWNKGKKKKK